MKTLMILTAALAIAVVNGFSAPTAYAIDACSGITSCTVFTTSTIQLPTTINGLAGADAICNARAAAANLPGTYKAWLADATDAPSNTFAQSTVPYLLTDGTTVVASNYTDLIDPPLSSPIELDEFAQAAPEQVWTNVKSDGTGGTFHCSNWTTASCTTTGLIGGSSNVTAEWTDNFTIPCCNSRTLYCFIQLTWATDPDPDA